MKPQELRIGNYVEWEDETRDVVRVTEILYSKRLNCYVLSGNEVTGNKEYIKKIPIHIEFVGVPLTEQWLLDFGSEEVNGEHFIDCGEYVLRVAVNAFYSKWFVSITTKENLATITIVYEYVHQLQNLYFALTGKELTK